MCKTMPCRQDVEVERVADNQGEVREGVLKHSIARNWESQEGSDHRNHPRVYHAENWAMTQPTGHEQWWLEFVSLKANHRTEIPMNREG